ncbi:hypothetical protein MWU65_07575 [Cellulophaga sp. F20128]|uniref:hypothetical protein n=1 Tax=Cellulophaga sp. F20128 TaxID=2926413 RepID=UPI001FF5AF68|nr:hypothetical protein [Cellulophaga sp. F20128]MCK0157036.1 hypothetical protein [Cellulophaga sp. F20128]
MKNLKKNKHEGNTSNSVSNKMKVLTIVCITAFVAITACSKNDDSNPVGDCGDFDWAQKAEKQIYAWSNAASAYSADPTTANCNSYKSAGNNYLNALEDIKNCVPSAGIAEFNQAIQEAKIELAQLECP